ncbi:MAG: Smr/MutS family protein [Rhodospirillales bacterium]|nr:Smr/MutS family protein [Rhodospirillales bacterium]
MRRGKVEIEARLDLHGMTQVEAHRSLLGFMERAHAGGKRSVLVITGKGLTRHGDIGVLRQAVPRWLNEPPIRAWIRGFDYAAPADGGEGALYILLRRKR